MSVAERDIDDLPRNPANYTALTPLWFLERAALVHPNRNSLIHASVRFTWSQTYRRCRQLASALTRRAVTFGSTVTAKGVYSAIANLGVTHFCAAPVVLNNIVNASKEDTILPLPRVVHPEWDLLPPEDQARMNARQGVRYIGLEGLDVVNTQNMRPVPADGATVGEIVFRGNVVMKGYLKNPKANKETFANGWYHSGDLAVKHPDGYIEIKDRSKDIIISGGENISSVEVENVLYQHPAILEVSVVARPDERWGESPCAFVTLKSNVHPSNQQQLTEDIMKFGRSKMPAYWVPKSVVFGPLPKTATGKIQKHVLRAKAKEMGPVKKRRAYNYPHLGAADAVANEYVPRAEAEGGGTNQNFPQAGVVGTDPGLVFNKALECFNDKYIYSSCDEAYRLTENGDLHVPPEYTDQYCNGPCLMETHHVLDCIDGILEHFVFYNRATLKDVRETIETGCSYGPKRGDFNVEEHIEADDGVANTKVPRLGFYASLLTIIVWHLLF
ncbi:UNVERIFIED_CONTAM: Acetate/butyrate--CoA ligase AAE7, peroxisomal [Sesamum radiatum]|uniref:Acetate/butyrate--CoA ligase AAE7, peroxisomal n=1 Tax=Sesamum radiatum TaxID=300843 RepID=A0AAW2QIY8_SESRA